MMTTKTDDELRKETLDSSEAMEDDARYKTRLMSQNDWFLQQRRPEAVHPSDIESAEGKALDRIGEQIWLRARHRGDEVPGVRRRSSQGYAYFNRSFGDTPEGPGVAVVRGKLEELRPAMDFMTSDIADRLVRDEGTYAGVVKHYLAATIGEAAALAVDRKMTAVRRKEKAGKKGAVK